MKEQFAKLLHEIIQTQNLLGLQNEDLDVCLSDEDREKFEFHCVEVIKILIKLK